MVKDTRLLLIPALSLLLLIALMHLTGNPMERPTPEPKEQCVDLDANERLDTRTPNGSLTFQSDEPFTVCLREKTLKW